MNTSTTATQARILRAIRDYSMVHGYAPSVRDIGKLAGLSSSSTAHAHLCNLQERRLLTADDSVTRTWRLTDAGLIAIGVGPCCCPHCGGKLEGVR